MNITTTARHCELDEGVRSFAQERLEKLARFARDISEIHLIVTAEKYRYIAEITLRMRGHELVGEEQSDQPRVAVDLAADRLEKQIRRVKERRKDWKKGDRTRTADRLTAASPSEDGEGAGAESSIED